jgi:deazaflavin-dependent oxidoreductase (nitroreductase family)
MGVQGQVLRFHDRLYQATDGRIGHKMIGVPTLLLRTTGRRSGQTRTSSLVYARDGADYLLVASNGGADKDPAWVFNLRADSKVEIQVGRERQEAIARILGPDDPPTSTSGRSSTRETTTATAPTRSRRGGRSRSSSSHRAEALRAHSIRPTCSPRPPSGAGQ